MVIEKKLTKEEKNLLDAVKQDNFRDVKNLIHTLKKKTKKSELGELNFQYDQGRTLLHTAAETGSKEMAEVLLGAGANAHLSDSNGFLPVHVACELAHSEIMRYLVETYPDEINRKTASGDTLLHLAVSGNHSTQLDIKFLVEKGVDMLVQNEKQETAFLKALKDSGRTEQACQLLKLAKQDRGVSHDDLMKMMTPGVKVAAEMGKNAVLQLCVDFGFDINNLCAEGTTALHCAVKFAQLYTIEFLLRNGARTDVRDRNGKSVEQILWEDSAPSDKLNDKVKQTITKCKQPIGVGGGKSAEGVHLPDRKLYPSLTVELGLDPNRNHPTEGEEEIQGDVPQEVIGETIGAKPANAEDELHSFAGSDDTNTCDDEYAPINESSETTVSTSTAVVVAADASAVSSHDDSQSNHSIENEATDDHGEQVEVGENENEVDVDEFAGRVNKIESAANEIGGQAIEGEGQEIEGEGQGNESERQTNEIEGLQDEIGYQANESEGQANEGGGQHGNGGLVSEEENDEDEVVDEETNFGFTVSLANEEAPVAALRLSTQRTYLSLPRSPSESESVEAQDVELTNIDFIPLESLESIETGPGKVDETRVSQESGTATEEKENEQVNSEEAISATKSLDNQETIEQLKSSESEDHCEASTPETEKDDITESSATNLPDSEMEEGRDETAADDTLDEQNETVDNTMLLDIPSEIDARINSITLGKVVNPDAGGGYGNVLLDLRERKVSVRPQLKSHLYLQEAVQQAIEEAAAEHQEEEEEYEGGSGGTSSGAQHASALFNFAYSPMDNDPDTQTLKAAEIEFKRVVIPVEDEGSDEQITIDKEEEKQENDEGEDVKSTETEGETVAVIDAEMGPSVAAECGSGDVEVSETEREQQQDWSEQDLMNAAGIGDNMEEFALKFEKEMLESMMPKDISEWLLQIRLRHFEPVFMEHGYDDIDFIGLDVLTAESLGFIGLKDPATIQKVLTSRVVKNCPRVPKLEDTDPPCENLSQWLNLLKLPQYETNFVEAGCSDDLSNIEDAWQLVLKKNKFNISCVGHRMRMLASLNIRDLRARMHKHLKDSGATSSNGDSLNFEDLQLDDIIDSTDDKENSNSERALTMGQVETATSKQTNEEQTSSCGNESSSDMPSTPASTPAPSTVEKQVIFTTQLSTLDTKSFDVGYLGVFPFNNIEPSEKTLIAACQATLKKGVKKVPKIKLEVNFCSIRLSDPVRGVVGIEHAIPNIQCAALNTDHRTFAYVVAERQASRVPINKNSKKTKGKGAPLVSTPQTVQRSQVAQPVLRLCYIFQTIDTDPKHRGGKEVMDAMKDAFLTAFKFVNENQPKSVRGNSTTA